MMRWLATADLPLLMLTMLLVVFGSLMIYSASTQVALRSGQATDAFLQKQAVAVMLGGLLFGVGMSINFDWLFRLRVPILAGVIVLLAVVLIPGVGKMVNGARRWLDLGFYQMQPSEFAKLAVIIFIAGLVRERRNEPLGSIMAVPVQVWLMLALTIVLIAVETDMGTAMTLAVIATVMLVLGGLSLHQVGGLAAGLIVAVVGVIATGHGIRRVMAWWDPWGDVGDVGYHITRAYTAFASGGLLGVGFGAGEQKLGYLPEPHTDFIFAVWGEELGLLGTGALVAVFLLFFMRSMKISGRTEDPASAMVGYGVGFWIVCQALINMLVVTGTIPTTGIPLPFISYGGSSLVPLLFGVGLLANLARRASRRVAYAA